MTDYESFDESFFKKWFELERRIGDEEDADIVKQKAIEWTQKECWTMDRNDNYNEVQLTTKPPRAAPFYKERKDICRMGK